MRGWGGKGFDCVFLLVCARPALHSLGCARRRALRHERRHPLPRFSQQPHCHCPRDFPGRIRVRKGGGCVCRWGGTPYPTAHARVSRTRTFAVALCFAKFVEESLLPNACRVQGRIALLPPSLCRSARPHGQCLLAGQLFAGPMLAPAVLVHSAAFANLHASRRNACPGLAGRAHTARDALTLVPALVAGPVRAHVCVCVLLHGSLIFSVPALGPAAGPPAVAATDARDAAG